MHYTGRFWELDKDNNILNDSSQSKINPEFYPLIIATKQIYLETQQDEIHSIYLTGSVSRGSEILYKSDLDAFAVLKKGVQHKQWRIKSAESFLLRKHPIVSDIQLELWPWDYVFSKNNFSIGAFILKTHSICIYGDDLTKIINNFKLNIEIAYEDISQIREDIVEAQKEIEKNTQPENIQYWCKRIMKNIIRTGFCLVMIQEKKFTRDLSLCASVFNKYYPDKEDLMSQALNMAENPTSSANDLSNFLSNFGSWLSYQADLWINENMNFS